MPKSYLDSGSNKALTGSLSTDSLNQVANGSGIAQLLADYKNLKFAFFNGCATKTYLCRGPAKCLAIIISTESSVANQILKIWRFAFSLLPKLVHLPKYLSFASFLRSFTETGFNIYNRLV